MSQNPTSKNDDNESANESFRNLLSMLSEPSNFSAFGGIGNDASAVQCCRRAGADEARKEARKVLSKAHLGDDPVADRKSERHALTVKELAHRYITEHVEIHNRPSTRVEAKRLVLRVAVPVIGSLKVHSVTRADIAGLHAAKSNTPRPANQMLAFLSKMFTLAEIWGYRRDQSNPCTRIRRYRSNQRDRSLSDAELARLGEALNWAEAEGSVFPSALSVIRVLALTGCRVSEVANLRWCDIDMERGVFKLPDSKTGPRTIVVADKTLAILAGIPKTQGLDCIFPGRHGNAAITANGVQSAWRVIRKRAGLEDVNLHDLRHTVGTIAAQTGANAFQVRDKLGHKTVSMTGRYVNQRVEDQRDLTEAIERRVSTNMDERANQGSTAQIPN